MIVYIATTMIFSTAAVAVAVAVASPQQIIIIIIIIISKEEEQTMTDNELIITWIDLTHCTFVHTARTLVESDHQYNHRQTRYPSNRSSLPSTLRYVTLREQQQQRMLLLLLLLLLLDLLLLLLLH